MPKKEKKQKSRRGFKAKGFWISAALSFIVLVIYVFSQPEIGLISPIGILDIIEAKTVDMRFRWRGERKPGNDIVIVAVDEKTYDDLGRWESSGRKWIAKLVDVLNEGGAKVIGFDLTLAEPDEGTALEVINAVKARYTAQSGEAPSRLAEMLSYLDALEFSHDYDQQLAQAIQKAGNVILGIYHFWEKERVSHLTPEKHQAHQQIIKRIRYSMTRFLTGTPQPLRLIHSYGVEPNLPIFSESAKSFGHFNFLPSRDGYVRYAPLLVEYREQYYPSMDLEIVRAYLNNPSRIIHALAREGEGIIDSIQLGKHYILPDERGMLLINFYGPGMTFPHYSMSDVVLKRIPPETFKEKIVILGFTSEIDQDLHFTTFNPDGDYPGVEIHATVIENILREDFLTQPEWAVPVDAFIILFLGIFLGFALQRMHPYSGALTAVICLIVVMGITHAAFLVQKIWLNATFPFLFIVLDYVVITTYKYLTEERKKKEIKHAFQHYVAPSVVDHMLDRVDQLQLGGERRQMTALFSDIRGFTSISEAIAPEDLVEFLNQYFTAMARIVQEYEGTVDKYMGDAIMAFYGAPLEQPDHAVRACKTAVDMIARLHQFQETQMYNTTWKGSTRQADLLSRLQEIKELTESWEARGLWPLNIGIGINSGEMIVGNMGSEERFDYTILGDHVNLASRLEGTNKQYGTNIIISRFTYDIIKDEAFIVRELDAVRVKGKLEPIIIYELMGYGTPDEQLQNLVKIFSEGLTAYKNRRWTQAIEAFRAVLRLTPADTPSKLYIERCQEYQQNPPPESWDGVFVMKTK